MNTKKIQILFVFGTRPEAIKLAPLIIKLKKEPSCEVSVCVTGQHRQMLDQVLSYFGITPDVDLEIMIPNQGLNMLSGLIFQKLDAVYVGMNPDWVIVHGDTTTSSVAAWAAYHRSIKVAHVEAGLRTYDKQAPFPEEINRQITARLADLHFAPTITARKNLVAEGIDERTVFVTGNTVIDALFWGLKKITEGYSDDEISFLNKLIDPEKKLIVVTGHRRENFGEGLIEMCEALKELAALNEVQIIYPVHLNPNVLKPIHERLSGEQNIVLIRPLGYPAFIYLMSMAYFILTDSGGVQEEAPSLGKPVLVMRETTERPEAIIAGGVKLVGMNRKKILDESKKLLFDKVYYESMSNFNNPYGDGTSSSQIVKLLLS